MIFKLFPRASTYPDSSKVSVQTNFYLMRHAKELLLTESWWKNKIKINTMMWNSPLFPAWASGPLQHTIGLSPPESVAQMNPDKSVIKGAKVW